MVTSRNNESDRLLLLYRSVGEMEATLRAMAESDIFSYLSESQVDEFNQFLEMSRRLVPGSVALREDIAPISEDCDFPATDAFRALHVTLLPALHNALPENQYSTT